MLNNALKIFIFNKDTHYSTVALFGHVNLHTGVNLNKNIVVKSKPGYIIPISLILSFQKATIVKRAHPIGACPININALLKNNAICNILHKIYINEYFPSINTRLRNGRSVIVKPKHFCTIARTS